MVRGTSRRELDRRGNDRCNVVRRARDIGNTNARMCGERPARGPCLILTSVTWEEVGLLLLRKVAWAGGIRLVIGRGQERVVDIGRMGNVADDWRLGRGGIRESGGTGRRNVRGLSGKGERLDIFIFYETPNVATSVFGIQDVLYLLLIATADPEEDSQRDEGDTTDTSHDTTDDGTDDGRRVVASSKADIIRLGTVVSPDLNNTDNDR